MTKSSVPRNSFSAYQEEIVKSRLCLIERQLEMLRSSKVEVKKISHLARLVAAHLSSVQNSPCSTSTLLRNEHYKELLKGFMVERSGLSKESDFDRLGKLPLHLRIELSNLRSEVGRLKKYIEKLEREVNQDDVFKVHRHLAEPVDAERDSHINRLDLAFAQSCQVVRTLLNYWGDYMGIDINRGEIIDLSFKRTDPRSVIVVSKAAKEFFEWLKNSELR
jgi:predicted RNase H-like nuclease (RuvC/YqgF family)